jgi:hypothetical protein
MMVMRQRGRRSAANLVTLHVDGAPTRLEPPACLSDRERKLFSELIAACDPRHFVESDLPLLTSFVQATVLAQMTANDPTKIETWALTVRLQAMLATRLRLAPQARTDPKTIARSAIVQRPAIAPWED